jgi:hypothetical protein
MKNLRFLCPNGHLGFAPIKTESFYLGVDTRPDFILADSGSDDIAMTWIICFGRLVSLESP